MFDKLPNDPIMLMSIVNMKLRDKYSDLDILCDDMGLDRYELISKLENAGFSYDETTHRFK